VERAAEGVPMMPQRERPSGHEAAEATHRRAFSCRKNDCAMRKSCLLRCNIFSRYKKNYFALRKILVNH
jgi:hypothetical protein